MPGVEDVEVGARVVEDRFRASQQVALADRNDKVIAAVDGDDPGVRGRWRRHPVVVGDVFRSTAQETLDGTTA